MRMRLANWTRLAVVVVVVAGTQTGCKSGWKMPGSDMFAWSKKPSESTLAGSSPSLAMPSGNPSGPVSPAQRNTPSPLVNNAANAGRSGSPYGATNASSPTFNLPPNNPIANMGGAGAAASSNGYTNGPYGMVANQPRPTGAPAKGGYGTPNSNFANNGYGTPNSSVANSSVANSGYGIPNSNVANSGYGATSNGYAPNAPAGYKPSGPTGYAQPNNAVASNPPSLPLAYGGGLPPGAGSSQAGMSAPSFANNSLQAMPAAYNAGPVNQMPPPLPVPNQSSMPNALPNSFQPSTPSVATQQINSAAPYRPGSVARTTGYDFSNQGPGGAVASSIPTMPPGMGLPPAISNTANGTPNGTPYGMNR
jgi:hypothetical protein